MLSPSRLTFIDVLGVYREIPSCPLSQRQSLRQAFFELDKLLDELGDFEIPALYDSCTDFRAIANRCLNLCVISPDWVDCDLLIRLLFRHQLQNGDVLEAYLRVLNRLDVLDLTPQLYNALIARDGVIQGWQAANIIPYGDLMAHLTYEDNPPVEPTETAQIQVDQIIRDLTSGIFNFAIPV